MKKWNICSLVVILIILITNRTAAQSVTLLKTTLLNHYPSASGVAFHDGKLYIVGDDAQKLLVLNADHELTDSVTFFPHESKRIPYQIKPDLESLFITKYKRKRYLVSSSSFSNDNRNRLYTFPLNDIQQFKRITNGKPIQYLKGIGIIEPNIEGSTKVNNLLVISNRANKSQPTNYLVTIPFKKRSIKKAKSWKKASIGMSDTTNIIGISGLEYWDQTDQLFFTASTEATNSANEDGAIGESYLGYFNGYSGQSSKNNLSPDALINLSNKLGIGNQKIEGVCIESYTDKSFILHLVADNDDGQSIVYKVRLTF